MLSSSAYRAPSCAHRQQVVGTGIALPASHSGQLLLDKEYRCQAEGQTGCKQTGFNRSECKLYMAPDTREGRSCLQPLPCVSACRELASWVSGQKTFPTLSLCPNGILCASHCMVKPGLPEPPVTQDAVGTLLVAHKQQEKEFFDVCLQ